MSKTKNLPMQEIPEQLRSMMMVAVGNTGSGKSAATRAGYVEPLLGAGRRVCMVDPTGVWWGLRFQADGAPGFRVMIVGGLYGDASMSSHSGELLGRWIAEQPEIQIIVDVSEMSVAQRTRFATDFFGALYRWNRRPLHLVVDEADEFGPQNPLPESRRMLHNFDRIVRRGRTKGFRVIMITQRPAVLHKNMLSQANVLIGMRLTASQDRAAIELWIRGQADMAKGKEVINTLSSMDTGEGWIWAPSANLLQHGRFPMFKTFDSSRTPADDEPAVEPPGPFPYKFPGLVALMRDGDSPDEEDLPPERASRTRSNPPAAAGNVVTPNAGTAINSYDEGYQLGMAEGLEQGSRSIKVEIRASLENLIPQLQRMIETVETLIRSFAPGKAAEPAAASHSIPARAGKNRIPEIPSSSANTQRMRAPLKRVAGNVNNSGGTALLVALARNADVSSTWEQAAILAGLRSSGGHFNRARKYLLDEGLVKADGSGWIMITQPGLKITGGRQPPLHVPEILQQWISKIDSPADRILQYFLDTRYMWAVHTPEAIGDRLGLMAKGGHWNRGMRAALDTGLIHKEGDRISLSTFLKKIHLGEFYAQG